MEKTVMSKVECSIVLKLNEFEVKAITKLIGNMSRSDMDEYDLSKEEIDLIHGVYESLPFKNDR